MIETDKKASSYYEFERPEVLELVPEEATRILDVGCGTGKLGEYIKKRQNAFISGIEPSNEAAEAASLRLDRVWKIPVENAVEGIPDESFDCIITADVLEHLVDPWTTLRQLYRKLTPGGKIVASIPNVRNWNVVCKLIEGEWQYEREGLLDRTHLRFFTRKSIEELFLNAGLKIVNVQTTTRNTKMPQKLLKVLKQSGMTIDSLKEEGCIFQYLVVAEKCPEADTFPKIGIVILNWNGFSDTRECLESVAKIDYPDYEVIVVDNGSTDGSPENIKEQFPDVTVLETGRNLGFAEGNNVGIKYALEQGADYILLLNNDTVVDSQILTSFLNVTQLHPDAGILGGKVYYYSVPDMIWNAGNMWDPIEMDFIFIGNGQVDDGTVFNEIRETDYITGCAMFIKATAVKSVGDFEPKYFLCWEEIDFCSRAKKAGFKCVFVPSAKIWHKIGASLGDMSTPQRAYFNTRNRLLWARRNQTREIKSALYRKFYRELLPQFKLDSSRKFSFPKKVYWALLQYKREFMKRYEAPLYRAKLSGVRDYFLNRFGDCPEEIRSLK